MMFLDLRLSLIMCEDIIIECVEDVSVDLLRGCCALFDENFEKTIAGNTIKIYPSRLKKYLVNSQLICVYKNDLLIGYMITEKMTEELVWIKQIVVHKLFRNKRIGTYLVAMLKKYRKIGIITNNPIMVKIIKSLGFSICLTHKIYEETFANQYFKTMMKLYCVEDVEWHKNNYLAYTNLKNTQKITEFIDCAPLSIINPGYEWIIISNSILNR